MGYVWTGPVMKHQCESVQGLQVPDVHGQEDLTGLWDDPPGTWRWRHDAYEGKRVLEAVLPSRYPEGPGVVHPYQLCKCPVDVREKSDPAYPLWGWDGNEEKPTLHGSILVGTLWGEEKVKVFWHGHLKEGCFCACE